MPRETPRAEQRRQRSWQCQALVTIGRDRDASGELNAHVCTLAVGHLALHLCWCGSQFDNRLNVYSQREFTW